MEFFKKQEGGEGKKYSSRIDRREFVMAWMKYDTIEEICDALGMGRQQVYNKATSLRTLGVKLPKKQRQTDKNKSVDVLNKLIEKLSKKG